MGALQQTLASIGGGAAPVSPISLVASAKQGGNADSNTTSAIDTTGAALLVAYVPYVNSGSPTVAVSDSKGNTWTALTAQTTGIVTGKMYYVANPSVGSGHTFTQTNSAPGVYSGIVAASFSLVANAAADNSTGSAVAAGAGTTIQPGSITPSVNDCVLITGVGYFDQPSARICSVDSGFTIVETLTDALTICIGVAYKVQTTAAAVNPTWTVPVNSNGVMTTMAAFKHT